MNAVVINASIPSLARQLFVAIAIAAWDYTKDFAKFSLAIGDWALRMVGFLTIMAYLYTSYLLLWGHEIFTSREAFARYKRWTLATARFIKRHSIATYNWIDLHSELIGQWMMDKLILRGSLGLISFEIEEEFRDGYVIVREFGDARNVPFSFRVENRRAVRKGLTGRNLVELRTYVMDKGYNIGQIVVGEKTLTPYAKLPEVKLPEVLEWKPAMELPNYRSFAPADILTRVA